MFDCLRSNIVQNRLNILHGGTIASMGTLSTKELNEHGPRLIFSLVDLGGSLAVASRGLFATGVSTDLNGKPLPISGN